MFSKLVAPAGSREVTEPISLYLKDTLDASLSSGLEQERARQKINIEFKHLMEG
jgi:hypothetical protein